MISRLLRCVREYKRPALLTPAFVLLEVAMDILLPLLMAKMIDDGVSKGDMTVIVKLSAALLACTLLALLFGVAAANYSSIASCGFAKNLRRDLYYNLQTFSFKSIDKFSTSSLITRMTTDITHLQMAFMMGTRIAVRAPATLGFSLIMAFGISPRLSMVFLAVLPALSLFLGLIMLKAHPYFKKAFKMYDRMNTVVQENLRGIRVVKNYVREQAEVEKFKNASMDIYIVFSKAQRLVNLAMPLMMLSMFTCTLLLSWLGGRMIVFGELTTGTLVSLLAYSAQILISLMMLSMIFMMMVMSRASAERVTEVLREETDLRDAQSPITKVPDGSIRFEDVSFSYVGDERKLTLKNVTLDIPSGQTVGIIGGTGAAKTTLVQLIPRLYDVTSGRVTVGGVDVRDCELSALRGEVAMVLQKNELFAGTIKENLRWGDQNATDADIERVCRIACADGFINGFPDRYDTLIEQGGSNVSGGQKQRLCIARALLRKPKILILDDSTSAVDTHTDAKIRKALSEELPETTKIIIAQRVVSVERADRIIVLNEGAVDAVGTHEQLLESNAIYREVYTSQQKGGGADASA